MLGEKLTAETYQEIVKNSILSALSLNEIVDVATNMDSFWQIAGTYYKFNDSNSPTIIIDREQSVGGYNNSELTLIASKNTVLSNNETFKSMINREIYQKNHSNINSINEDEDIFCK